MGITNQLKGNNMSEQDSQLRQGYNDAKSGLENPTVETEEYLEGWHMYKSAFVAGYSELANEVAPFFTTHRHFLPKGWKVTMPEDWDVRTNAVLVGRDSDFETNLED